MKYLYIGPILIVNSNDALIFGQKLTYVSYMRAYMPATPKLCILCGNIRLYYIQDKCILLLECIIAEPQYYILYIINAKP